MKKKTKYMDSSLESKGAEYLVLGQLLIEGISAYKCDQNTAAFDLVAVNPDRNTSCKVQVKSRWATDHNGSFPFKNFGADFVVCVALNRGLGGFKKNFSGRPKQAPQYYVFPIALVRQAMGPDAKAIRLARIAKIEPLDDYVDRFDLIAERLSAPTFVDRVSDCKLELVSAGTGAKLIDAGD
jgi:hypothetical protein